MTDNGKQDERPDKIHAVRWDADDWDRVVLLTRQMAAEEHLDLNEADIIRKATRALLEARLGPREVLETVPEQRSGQERRRVG